MNIIVVGCGRLGAELAYRMDKNHHKVTIIDQSRRALAELPEDFHGHPVEGDALSEEVLIRAGIGNTDGLAAVTSSDMVNAVVAHIATEMYHVKNAVVRNYDSRFRSLHETFGHQLVSSTSWGAQRIEELLYHEKGLTVFSAGNGEIELYEFLISEALAGQPLKAVLPVEGCLAAAITRAGQAFLPNPDSTLEAGDFLLVSATIEGSTELRNTLLAAKDERVR